MSTHRSHYLPAKGGSGKQPSKAARRKVADAFDADKLAHLCTTWDFTPYAEKVDLPRTAGGRERFYWHKDNGSNVLAVAHLDSVQSNGTCSVVKTASGLLACSGTLDDRLGVYVILELLPALGITCDVLLTTDEEIAQSTAEWFDTNKEYNWMFQFDRGGTDVVMYEYETPELVKLVEASGARVGIGSFSDICMLSHLGCAGFNWGVGYEDYHSARAHAWLDDTFRMVARFVKFYNANADTPFVIYDDGPDDGKPDKWDDQRWIIADCGHAIDVDDDSSYVAFDGSSYVMCIDCGTMPDHDADDF